ncbi:MAG: hypothetical protein ABIP95_14710 [Pelobium sp.]
MKYGVSETAHLLSVKKETVKSWSFTFSEYLSSGSNIGKGEIRQFEINDIRVFAYVSMYWEDEPDIENIMHGLNTNSQFEHELIDDFIIRITPLFRRMPDNIDETWGGVVFGGEFELGDTFATADSFKLAGDKIVEIAHNNDEERELFQPAIYITDMQQSYILKQ